MSLWQLPFPGRNALRATKRLQLLVRVCCVSTFLGSSLVPLYIPTTNFSVDAVLYLTSDQFLLVEEGFVMKTASISEQGHRLAYTQGVLHRVGSGESLLQIADLYRVSLETIQWANNLQERAIIHPGEELLILPVDGVLHTVRRGQSLSKIAELYSVSLEDILRQNQLSDRRVLAQQQIIIPGGRPLLGREVAALVELQEESEGPQRTTPEPPRPIAAPKVLPPSSSGILQKPCDCTYTQYYHPGHYAVDMASNGGRSIFAAADGIVMRAEYGWNGGYGNVVEIDHGNNLITLYAHNQSLHVREGQIVRRGDVIATMGKSGRVYGQTGVHLHFETILQGVKKNPLLYLQ